MRRRTYRTARRDRRRLDIGRTCAARLAAKPRRRDRRRVRRRSLREVEGDDLARRRAPPAGEARAPLPEAQAADRTARLDLASRPAETRSLRGCFRTTCSNEGSARSVYRRCGSVSRSRSRRAAPVKAPASRTDRPEPCRATSPCEAAARGSPAEARAAPDRPRPSARSAEWAERYAGRDAARTPDRRSGGRGCRDRTSSRS